ncbi:MAG TPA: M13 family metallopeptidase [Bryobacteraceae bacterium]|nr:M13 family metallopeptidase [Bryobacteraceae bacterium]
MMKYIFLFSIPFLLSAQDFGFSKSHMDLKAGPCQDFYRYACGTWLDKNPVPADRSLFHRAAQMAERNQTILRDILETSAAKSGEQMGDYWSSCIDEKGVEAKAAGPLKPVLERIAGLPDKTSIAAELARLHLIGSPAFFTTGVLEDQKDTSKYLFRADQGGLGLPDRDYYTKTDAKSEEIRKGYVAHISRMFQLTGDSQETASRKAESILTLETELAKVSMDRVTRRDPNKTYNKKTVSELAALTPSFNWDVYLSGSQLKSKVQDLNVAVPDFFKGLEQVLSTTSLDTLKTYMTWGYLRMSAPVLSSAFVNENFNFFGRTLSGQKELQPRWKRCVAAVDSDLGESLGKKYVELTFGKEGKDKMLAMVHNLEIALRKDIEQLDWMTPTTKKGALEKLQAITNKIGYPEKWKDYSSIKITRDDFLGNSQRSNTFAREFNLNKLGKSQDKSEWVMTPPTVNAYYHPLQNNINFPAGILQPPFFDKTKDDAVNYGAIGMVIGHELTHGFDDSGRRFDAKGNVTDWWTAEDGKAFEERASCIDKQYSEYTAIGDVKLNGKLTLGENVADHGGLRIAYLALHEALKTQSKESIDGFTADQRFFLGYAQINCANVADERARMLALTDPHSPGKYRVNGVLSNMPEFQSAFGCKADQPMVRANACRVW